MTGFLVVALVVLLAGVCFFLGSWVNGLERRLEALEREVYGPGGRL